MSKRLRRVIFWLLFAGYAAGSAWWVLSVPYMPGRILDSIPGHATIVTQHDRFADRWDDINRNVMVKILVSVLGVDPADWDKSASDPELRRFMELAGRHEIVMAYIPNLGDQASGYWVAAGWVGSEGQQFRWLYPWIKVRDLERMDDIGGWPVWQWNASGTQITLVLAEGVLLATSAQEAQAIQLLVDTYNGNFPSIVDRSDRRTLVKDLLETTAPDRGWYTPPSRSGSDYWFLEMSISGTSHMNGTVRTPKPAQLATPPLSVDWSPVSRFWSDKPMGAVVAGVESALFALDHQKKTIPLILLRELLLRSDAEAAALALFGGEYSGRIMTIKVPAVMMAMHTRQPVDLASFLPPLVDRWNAAHRLGLVAVPAGDPGSTVWRLEGTAGGFYGSLAAEQQVALTSIGSWIVLSSNYKTLEKVMQESESGVTGSPIMERLGRVTEGSIAAAGLDLVPSTVAFRMALAAYSIKLMFEDSDDARARRQKINEMKAWLDTAALMENLRVRASAGTDIFQFDFEAGPQGAHQR